MTNITELAQKPTRYGTNSQGVFTNQADGAYVSYQDFLVLVEALEKAWRYIEELREWNAGLAQESFERQQRIAELEVQRELAFAASNRWADKLREAERRIAELESRTVTVKLPNQTEFDDPLSAYQAIEKCKEALTTTGIKWEAE